MQESRSLECKALWKWPCLQEWRLTKTCLAARELQPSLDMRRHSWGCVQLQEASLQLARTQHSYDELQRKQESLISEMEDAIARRTAIQIKVSAPPAASLVMGCVLCAPCKGPALVRV